MKLTRCKDAPAFSLVEILVAMVIIGLLSVLSGPALRSILGAGSVNAAASDLSQTLQFARAFAMSHNTYVRVAFAELPESRSSATPITTLAVLTIYSANGSLDSDTAADMSQPQLWPQLNPPLKLRQFRIDDALNAAHPATGDDSTPSGSDISDFTRKLADWKVQGNDPQFSSCIQFNPSGEVRVEKGVLAEFVKIACVRGSLDPQEKNPFILRLSGVNGTVEVLRKEQL